MKILIIRLSSMGDIVLTSPVIRCLKTQTNNEIHYLTKNAYSSVINNNPYIDKIHFLNEHLEITIKQLKAENYDYIIDLHNNAKSIIIKSHLIKPSSTVKKLNVKKLILTTSKINILPNVHIVDRYMDTIKKLGIVYDGKGLDFFIDKNEDIPSNVLLPEKYFVFAIGGQHATKIVPTDIIIKMCNTKYRKNKFVLIGGQNDVNAGNEIFNNCRNVINLTGQLSVNQSAKIINNADTVFTGDTGMMHIAAALKKNIISFWGNTVPQFGMYPFFPQNYNGKSIIVENKSLKCRPCSKIGHKKCPLGHFQCMRWLENMNF